MSLNLAYYPDPVLRRRAEQVKTIDSTLRERVRQMFELMYEEHGIGLAAPQVSWSTRLFVVNVGGAPDQGDERVFINPEIVASNGEVIEEEGCLSIPEIRAKVARKEQVTVRAQDLDGRWFSHDADGLLARAIQHEIDHLDGILFIQRLSATDKLTIKKALEKLKKEGPPAKRSSTP